MASACRASSASSRSTRARKSRNREKREGRREKMARGTACVSLLPSFFSLLSGVRMSQVFNFSAGPAALPADVMRQAREEFLDVNGSGLSAMEMSHRSKGFLVIAEQAESDLRELLSIPSNYKVLFLQGGATLQFAMVPLNLLRGR